MLQSLVIAIILLSLIGVYINMSSPTFFKNEKLFEKALKQDLEHQKVPLQNKEYASSNDVVAENTQIGKRVADFRRQVREENRYGIKKSPEYYSNSTSFTINDNSNVTSSQAIQVVPALPPPAVTPTYEGLPANYNPNATNTAIINRGASVVELSTKLTSRQFPIYEHNTTRVRSPYSTEFEINDKPNLYLTSYNKDLSIIEKRKKKIN